MLDLQPRFAKQLVHICPSYFTDRVLRRSIAQRQRFYPDQSVCHWKDQFPAWLITDNNVRGFYRVAELHKLGLDLRPRTYGCAQAGELGRCRWADATR